MKRLLTAAVGVPFILGAIFLLPPMWFFVFVAFALSWAAWEYVDIVRARAPHAPVQLVLVLIPAAAAAMSLPGSWPGNGASPWLLLLLAFAVISIGLGVLLL